MQYCTRNPTLKKPEYTDARDIVDLNDNMDYIDTLLEKANLNGAVDPAVTNDSGDGYSINSVWWNVSGHKLFMAESVATGAAVWRQVYPALANEIITKSAATDPAVGDDTADGYIRGSRWWNTTGHKLFEAESVATGSASWRQIWPILLTANQDLGAFQLKALQFESDIDTGTGAPFVVASTAKVTNLQADSVDGNEFEPVTTKGDIFVALGAGDLDRLPVGANGKILTADSGSTLGIKWGDAASGVWTAETNFTARPPGTSTITMTADKTATILVGYGLKYTWNGNTYYGIVTAITNNLLTIAGAPLSASYDVTALSWCDHTRIEQVDFFIPGAFSDAANTGLLASDAHTKFRWGKAKSYMVQISHTVRVDDTNTATHALVTLSINGSVIGTSNTNAGEAVATTWTSTVVGINVSNYDINFGEAIEVVTDASGGNDNAVDLTVSAVFVMP